ncbi:MAG: ACP S-malonyltransferase [Sedimentisphaerales bacterium]|nr:ACP S-malonyltransferase [Sedimentisphaerales bacterium]
MKIAYLFPGQGAQFVGMGAEFTQSFPEAAQIFQKANDILGFDLKKICFDGPSEKLNTTVLSQPAIFTTSAAILETLKYTFNSGIKQPDATAGLSLGEYTALYAAGLISFEQALVLVHQRGQAMQDAAEKQNGAMVSIIGLDEEKVRHLCDDAARGELLQPVNFNCPGQIVISGDNSACSRAEQMAEKYGAIKAIRLEVAGAFHTKLMAGAAENLAGALKKVDIREPSDIKVIANISAEYYQKPHEITDGLVSQLTCPILWQKCMERLISDGVEEFYEIGPARVLTGLMKRIDRKAKVINISNVKTLKTITRITA